MDFELSDEQRQIRSTLAEFAEHEIKPYSAKWDKEDTFPRHVVEKLGELGFLGVSFPEKYGGGGPPTPSQVVVVEGPARDAARSAAACAPPKSVSSGHIAEFPSGEQRPADLPDTNPGKKPR